MKIKPENLNKIVLWHKFPCVGTNGLPRYDEFFQPETITGTVTHRVLKKPFWEETI